MFNSAKYSLTACFTAALVGNFFHQATLLNFGIGKSHSDLNLVSRVDEEVIQSPKCHSRNMSSRWHFWSIVNKRGIHLAVIFPMLNSSCKIVFTRSDDMPAASVISSNVSLQSSIMILCTISMISSVVAVFLSVRYRKCSYGHAQILPDFTVENEEEASPYTASNWAFISVGNLPFK